MKRIAILVLLLASVASAAYLRILAEYAVNGTLTTTDSIRVNLYYGGTQYNYLTTNKSNLDTVVVVDTTGVYSYWARYYLSGAEKLRDFRNAQAMSGVDFVTGTQIDSVLNAIEDANKPNFKATGFATSTQGDSLTGAISDANKANFKATGFSTFNPASDSVTLDRTNTLLYTGNFNTAYSTFNVATDSVTIDRTNTLLYLGNFNTAYSTLTASDNIGINWNDISNPTATVGLSGTTILKSSNVDNIASTDTITTVLGNVNGSVASVTGKVTLVDSSANDIAMMGNYHALDSTWQKEMHDSLDTQGWAATGSSTGLDSATTSRIIKRTVWGVASGTGSDSTTKAQRIIGSSPAGDTINAHAPHGNNWATTGASAVTPDTIRDIIGDSLATFASAQAVTDSVRKVVGDSIRTQVLPIKNRTDSLAFAGVLTNPSFLRPTTAGRTLDVTTTGEAGVDLSNVNGTLDAAEIGSDAITAAKIAADAIGASEVASGAIVFGTEATGFFNYTSNKVTLVDSSANDIAMMGNYHALDSTWQKEMHDSLDTQTWAISGSVSLTDADIDTIAARTAALIGASQLYPLLDRIVTVDAPGAIPKQQFVCDSTSLGGANEYGLLNTAVRVKDVDDGKWSALGIIERVSCTADQCTLQVADTLAFAVEANDTVFVYGGGPAFVQATVYEAATILVDSLLGRDLTGVPQDSLVGGLLKIAALSGGTAFDTTQFLTMWLAHGWYAAMDSLVYRLELGNSNSLPVLADLFTQAQFEAFNMNVAKIKGSETLVIDTARNAGGTIDYDTIQARVELAVADLECSGSSGCPDSGGFVVTIYAYDTTNAEVVENATIRVKSSLTGATRATATTRTGGFFQFTMANGKHYLLANANGVTFAIDSVTVADAALTDTIYGSGFVIAAPSAANLATVSGQADCYSCQVRFILDAQGAVTDTSTSQLVTKKVYNTKTDANGQFSQELPKTGNMLYQSGTQVKHPKWRILISPTDVLKEPKLEMSFEIPADSTTLNIGGLIQ